MSPLAELDFFSADGSPADGLVSVKKPAECKSPHEHAVVRQAQRFDFVDYVFFRRFEDDDGRHLRSSQVLAYVVDNTRQERSKQELAQLHWKLWLQGVAPLVYVAWPASVDVLSCARKPDFWDGENAQVRYSPAEKVELSDVQHAYPLAIAAEVSDAIAKRMRFSANRLANGTFWEDGANQKLARDSAAAHRQLIDAIVEADAEIKGGKNPIRRRLLVLTVLITYLEDRRVFPPGLFGRFRAGVRSFRELLRVGTVDEVTKLLQHFEKKFNGDVFSLPKGEALTDTDLRRFARLVEAKTLGGQKHFWELFSFEYIPVEVISRLYQRFVTGHGAVYTPPLLVSLLLDQVMPFDRITGKERVLDPACGSGIFLVGAFKRLVIHWRSKHRWKKPTVEVLKSILSRSIHGVEMESSAVDLTAFSLCLALCDFLDPPVIWSELKLNKLRDRNLREGDFFDPIVTADSAQHVWPKEFDVVIGNPPFESALTPAAEAVRSTRPSDSANVSDDNVAYLFVEQGVKTLSESGSLCMLQPHGLIYGRNTAELRRHLMHLARLVTVLDFASIRGIFDGADVKTIAWHAVRQSVENTSVSHVTFRRTYAAAARIGFEVDHYDWHSVRYDDARDDPFVWRANLLGGGRLLHISQRIRDLKTTLAGAVQKPGWAYGEGFIVGNRANPTPWLHGLKLLPTSAFDSEGINFNELKRVTDTHFEAPRTRDLYTSPLILIKEHFSLPVEFWNDGSLAFGHSIVGIHAPISDILDLQRIYDTFKSKSRLYQFLCLLNGHRALVGKATAILKKDIDLLPMPDDPSDLDLSFWEDVLAEDVLEFMADFVRLGQKSVLLRESATEMHLNDYSSLYVRMLGSVYSNLKAADAIRLNGLIAMPFYFGKQAELEWLNEGSTDSLERLIYDTSREALRVVRVVRYYENNVILIVKPDRLRYWIRSTAIRDADDTLVDLRQQGW